MTGIVIEKFASNTCKLKDIPIGKMGKTAGDCTYSAVYLRLNGGWFLRTELETGKVYIISFDGITNNHNVTLLPDGSTMTLVV